MTALVTKEYKKTQPPLDDKSRIEYLEQQFRELEVVIRQLRNALLQLQTFTGV